MKILHVITSLKIGGAEKLLVEILPRLKDMGHEVDLLLFDGINTPFYNQLESNGIKINYLNINGNVYNPINIIRLRKYLSGYDIIHTHNTACQYYVPIALVTNINADLSQPNIAHIIYAELFSASEFWTNGCTANIITLYQFHKKPLTVLGTTLVITILYQP